MIPRYTLPEMAAVWSDEARLGHWLRIEVLACEAWARLGRIPEADLTAIRTRASFCRTSRSPWGRRDGGSTSG